MEDFYELELNVKNLKSLDACKSLIETINIFLSHVKEEVKEKLMLLAVSN